MKLASYIGTRSGIVGLANVAIRFRLGGKTSHSEIVFEPGDGVDSLMPDGSLEPDANGALWCASSVAADHMPSWSSKRAGKIGGVRFKRIVLEPEKWVMHDVPADPFFAATWAKEHEGMSYDWNLIIGYLVWNVRQNQNKVDCSEACASMMNIPEPWRFDPCTLDAAVRGFWRT